MKIIFLMILFAFAAIGAEFSGYIADSKCGVKGAKEGHKACAEGCVKAGASPVLVSEGKVFKISNPDKVMDHVGDKVKVSGSAEGDTVTVSSIAAAE